MRIPVRFSLLTAVAALLCVGIGVPVTTFAGGGPAKPAATPKPDTQKKVWTNDDVERLNPEFVVKSGAKTGKKSSTAVGVVVVQPVRSAPAAVAPGAPLDPQQDPRWYAQQVTELNSELAAVDSRDEQLREFRATGAGLATGLVLNAPCEGVGTDNLIAQLDARRQEIMQQIDALGDTARQNGLPPGILVEGRGLELVASQPSAVEQRAAATREARDASEELAQVQGVVDGMQDQLAGQGITLLQPAPGEGGNMTTDLLNRLGSRENALLNEINSADDTAQALGIPPGDLR